MTTVLIVIGVLIMIILIYSFFFKESRISKTYSKLIYQFNLMALKEKGYLVTLNKSNVKLFLKGTGQVIDFKMESNNDLTISWSYRYF